jgi:hypothetical protein
MALQLTLDCGVYDRTHALRDGSLAPELHLEETDALLGRDPFPYGLEANHATLETFLGYCLEQGLIDRPLTVHELFAPETHDWVEPALGRQS